METNPTQLSTVNEVGGDALEVTESTETLEDSLSNSEELIDASEILRADIEKMHDSSVEVVEQSMANPIETQISERGAELGLSPEEISTALASGGYAEKDAALRNEAGALHKTFLGTLAKSARVGVAGFLLGSSTPVIAEAPLTQVELGGIMQQEESVVSVNKNVPVNLKMGETLRLRDEVTFPTYKEAKRDMEYSIQSPVERVALFSRENNENEFTTTIIQSGNDNNVRINVTPEVEKVMNSNTTDTEMMHTHPINASTRGDFFSEEDERVLKSGSIPRITMQPSKLDMLSLVVSDAYNHPSAQFSSRVIDPAGEWEYGIEDSSAPAIVNLRRAMEEGAGPIELTPEENSYLEKIGAEKMHPELLIRKLAQSSSDELAREIEVKYMARANKINKYIDPEYEKKFNSLFSGLSPWLHPGTREGDAVIAEKERIAKELGFRLKFTPRSSPEVGTTDSGVKLKMDETIDDTSVISKISYSEKTDK